MMDHHIFSAVLSVLSDADGARRSLEGRSGGQRRDAIGDAGPLHVSTDAAIMQTTGDIQSYSLIAPAWQGPMGPGEAMVFSPLQVALVVMPHCLHWPRA